MRRKSLGLTAALTLLLPSDALGQTVTWIDQFGSGGNDVATGVVATTTDVFVAGLTDGELSKEANAGGFDAFLRRLDSQGNEVWQVQFGTSGDESATAVAMDSTGLYVAGSIDGRFPGEVNGGSEDGFLAKYGFDGSPMWIAQFGTRRWDVVTSVVADGSGVYVLGYTEGVFPGELRLGSGDLFLTRFTANGEQDWITQFGSSGVDYPAASVIGPSGVVVAGETFGRLPGQRPRGAGDVVVATVDLEGVVSWVRLFGTRKVDSGDGIVADGTGVYVTGSTDGVFKGQRDRPSTDGFVRKLDGLDGRTLWTRQFGTRGADYCENAALVIGEIACVGNTTGTLAGQTSAGGYDIFVKTFDASTAEPGFTLQFGGRSYEAPLGAATSTGRLYVAGYTEGRFPGQSSLGGDDAFVTGIDPSDS
jgi:hypothetical protein